MQRKGRSKVTLEEVLRACHDAGAIEIHLSVGQHPRVRELDLSFKPLDTFGVVDGAAMASITESVLEQLSAVQRAFYERNGYVECAIGKSGVGRFRVSLYRQRGTNAISIEAIPTDAPRLEAQGYNPLTVEAIRTALAKQSGIILVAGPFRSGKTTATAAIVEEINRSRAAHIIKLENPVEYLHRHERSLVHQIELGTDALISERLLLNILRCNPDVLVVDVGPELPLIGGSHLIKAALAGRLIIIVLEASTAHQAYMSIMRLTEEAELQAMHEAMRRVLLGTVMMSARTAGGYRFVEANWFTAPETTGM